MTDDDPITLADACGLYPNAKLTVSTLKAEAGRGRLNTYKIGRRLYTTIADIRGMVDLCRVEQKAPGFTLTRSASSGLSETERAPPH